MSARSHHRAATERGLNPATTFNSLLSFDGFCSMSNRIRRNLNALEHPLLETSGQERVSPLFDPVRLSAPEPYYHGAATCGLLRAGISLVAHCLSKRLVPATRPGKADRRRRKRRLRCVSAPGERSRNPRQPLLQRPCLAEAREGEGASKPRGLQGSACRFLE